MLFNTFCLQLLRGLRVDRNLELLVLLFAETRVLFDRLFALFVLQIQDLFPNLGSDYRFACVVFWHHFCGSFAHNGLHFGFAPIIVFQLIQPLEGLVEILDLIEDHIPEALQVLHFGLFGASLELAVVYQTNELFESLVNKELCFADRGPDVTDGLLINARLLVHNMSPFMAQFIHQFGLRVDQLSEVICG